MNLLDLPYNIKYDIIKYLGPFKLTDLFWTHSDFQIIILKYLNYKYQKKKSNINFFNYEIFNLNFNLFNNIPITNHYMNYYNFGYKIFSDETCEIRNYSLNLINNHKKHILLYKKLDKKQIKYFNLLLLYYKRYFEFN